MTIRTNVPTIQFTPQGLILPTEQDILQGVMADFNAAFGGELSQNLETPQGQLASSMAAIIADKNNQIAWLVNNLDPTYADGIMQDAIAKIYFLKRKGRVNSFATCHFIGLPGVTIPKGLVVKDASNNEWILDEEISILENGAVEGRVVANGVYSAKANTITKIHQSIIGLDRVINPQDAIVGTERESRQDFAERFKKSVAINSQGMPASVYANVSKLAGVTDCYVIDNPKGIAVQVGSSRYSIKPHSIYVAVMGGDDQQIAEEIWRYTGNGCDYNGNSTITVTDNTYTDPKPTYEIQFMRPNTMPIYFQVKLKRGAVIGSEQTVKEVIPKTFQRLSKSKIGATLYAVEFVSDLVKALPEEHLLDVKVGLNQSAYTDTVTVGIDQYPTIAAENINVVFV